jgi:AAA+ superfamily predicted ATPase
MIEEHFGDHDVLLMSDAIAFAIDGDFSELRFDLSELTSRFVTPLRRTLLQAGVELDADEASSTLDPSARDSNHDAMK